MQYIESIHAIHIRAMSTCVPLLSQFVSVPLLFMKGVLLPDLDEAVEIWDYQHAILITINQWKVLVFCIQVCTIICVGVTVYFSKYTGISVQYYRSYSNHALVRRLFRLSHSVGITVVGVGASALL